MQEMQEIQVRSLGREAPLEEGMATHSSILAWRIPWKRSLVGYSPWGHGDSQKSQTQLSEQTCTHTYTLSPDTLADRTKLGRGCRSCDRLEEMMGVPGVTE